MEVLRAKTAGFCMGVSLALQKLEKALNHINANETLRICTLGPLIHNPQAMEQYTAQGMVCIEDASELHSGDSVIIRAHGIPREMEKNLRDKNVNVIDATCPKVKKAQLAIASATQGGIPLLLFGEAEHPEVRGLISYAHGEAHVFSNPKDGEVIARQLKKNTNNSIVVLASQTTQSYEAYTGLKATLGQIFPELCTLSTVCAATQERQEEAKKIALQSEVMVVVGGRQSGNTRRLADVVGVAGIPTFLVETEAELQADNFVGKSRIGLTAGASTPRKLIDAVELRLLNF